MVSTLLGMDGAGQSGRTVRCVLGELAVCACHICTAWQYVPLLVVELVVLREKQQTRFCTCRGVLASEGVPGYSVAYLAGRSGSSQVGLHGVGV